VVAEGLTRSFNQVLAVDAIDMKVSRGEIYGFLGPNGAGKTTLVRMLITLLMPTGGRGFISGKDVVKDAREVRLRVGAALQESALDNKQTGRELVRLQGRLYGLSGREIDQRLRELSSLIDIGDAMDRLIGTYSGGMKRRLDLAAALVHNPEVLFLDEPTTGLDPISRARVWEEVRRINAELGVTIFLTTQYLEEADELAHRVGIINQGKLVVEGTPSELKRTIGTDLIITRIEGDPDAAWEALRLVPQVEQVDIHGPYRNEITICVSNGAESISNVALALNRSGVTVRELTLRTPTLDDVFLQVTGSRLQGEEAPGEVTA
jgi:ABC-2 type transport system ATP-binding protein